MATLTAIDKGTASSPNAARVDMKFELVVIPGIISLHQRGNAVV